MACSSSAPPAASPAAGAAATSESVEAPSAEARMHLEPVAAPRELVARATWRDPARLLDTVAGWMQPGLDWRALAAGPLEELSTVIDFTQPIDAAVALDPSQPDKPRAHFAIAAGLTSHKAALDAFRARGGPVDFVEPGVYSVQLGVEAPCFVAAALGPAPARLVCSENRESLEALSPYLTRGEPSKTAAPANLSVEVLAEPLWQRFGQQAEMLKSWLPLVVGELPVKDDALAATISVAARAIADEAVLFLGDLSRLHLELDIASNSQSLDLTVGSDYRAARSWLAQTAAQSAARAAVAPDAYWILPADATSATHSAPGDPARTQGIMRVVGELLDGGLKHLGAGKAEREGWIKAYSRASELTGPWVSANGMVPPELQAKPLADKSLDEKEQARVRLGYKLFGVKDDGDSVNPLLERTVKLYEDPTLRKSLAQRYGVDAAKLPQVKQRRTTQAIPGQGTTTLRTYELILPAALLDEAKPKSPDAPPATGTVSVLVTSARSAPWTWVGISSYDKLLEEKLRSVYDPGARKATLATRPGLEPLRSEPAAVAGFMTLAEIVASYPLDEQQSPAALLAALPNLGQTPMLLFGRTTPDGPKASAALNLPKAVFQDLGAVLLR
ncbi:MAG: hypothetical protein ABW217_08155 [Polyangiaceae bacterium]